MPCFCCLLSLFIGRSLDKVVDETAILQYFCRCLSLNSTYGSPLFCFAFYSKVLEQAGFLPSLVLDGNARAPFFYSPERPPHQRNTATPRTTSRSPVDSKSTAAGAHSGSRSPPKKGRNRAGASPARHSKEGQTCSFFFVFLFFFIQSILPRAWAK